MADDFSPALVFSFAGSAPDADSSLPSHGPIFNRGRPPMVAHLRRSVPCLVALWLVTAAPAEERLTARARPKAEGLPRLEVGELRTEDGQRKCVELPHGSILYVNARTTVRLD